MRISELEIKISELNEKTTRNQIQNTSVYTTQPLIPTQDG